MTRRLQNSLSALLHGKPPPAATPTDRAGLSSSRQPRDRRHHPPQLPPDRRSAGRESAGCPGWLPTTHYSPEPQQPPKKSPSLRGRGAHARPCLPPGVLARGPGQGRPLPAISRSPRGRPGPPAAGRAEPVPQRGKSRSPTRRLPRSPSERRSHPGQRRYPRTRRPRPRPAPHPGSPPYLPPCWVRGRGSRESRRPPRRPSLALSRDQRDTPPTPLRSGRRLLSAGTPDTPSRG